MQHFCENNQWYTNKCISGWLFRKTKIDQGSIPMGCAVKTILDAHIDFGYEPVSIKYSNHQVTGFSWHCTHVY